MSDIKTGGSAFPALNDDWKNDNNGMTLRDYFAAKSLATVMKNYCDFAEKNGYDEDWRVGVAIDAYSIADAMIKARDL